MEKVVFWQSIEKKIDDKIDASNGCFIVTDFEASLKIEKAKIIDKFKYDNYRQMNNILQDMKDCLVVCYDANKEYQSLMTTDIEIEQHIQKIGYIKTSNFEVISYKNLASDKNGERDIYVTINNFYRFLIKFDKEYFIENGIKAIGKSTNSLTRTYAAKNSKEDYTDYLKAVKAHKPKNYKQYQAVERSLWGGFGNVNDKYIGQTVKGNIFDLDISSQYSEVMLYHKYMCGTRSEILENEEASKWLNNYYLKIYNTFHIYQKLKGYSLAEFLFRYKFEYCGVARIKAANIRVKENKKQLAFIPQSAMYSYNNKLEKYSAGNLVESKCSMFAINIVLYPMLLDIYDFDNLEIDYVEYCKTRFGMPFITNQIKKYAKEKQEKKNAGQDYSVEKLKLNGVHGNLGKKYFYEDLDRKEIEDKLKKLKPVSCRLADSTVMALARLSEFFLIDLCNQSNAEWLYSDTDSAYIVCDEKTAKEIANRFNKVVDIVATEAIGSNYYGIGHVEVTEFKAMRYLSKKCYFVINTKNTVETHVAGIDLTDFANDIFNYGLEELEDVFTSGYVVDKSITNRLDEYKADSEVVSNRIIYSCRKPIEFTINSKENEKTVIEKELIA